LHAVSAEGERLWRFDSGLALDLWAAPSVDEERERVYFTGARGHRRGMVFSVSTDGREIWRARLPAGTRGGAAIGRGDRLAIACLDGHLALLRRSDGRELGRVRLADAAPPTLWTTPAIDPNERILVATVESPTSGSVCCIDPETLRVLWRLPMGKSHATPVVDAKGRLFVGSWIGDARCYQS
jgi:outer membrane protein assembly factor BamB